MIDLATLPPPLHFWRCRLVAKGPWVPAVTFFGGPLVDGEILDRSPRWQVIVRLEQQARVVEFGDACPIEVSGIMLRNIERIEEGDYRYLRDHGEWATKHAPAHPDAAPTTPVDRRGKSVW